MVPIRRARARVAARSILAVLLACPSLATAAEGALFSGGLRPVRDLLFERADLAGRVFVDLNGDRRHDPLEPLVPDVRVVLASGFQAKSDVTGAYHLRELLPGQVLVTVDPSSLPLGARPPPAQVLELPAGGLAVVDIPLEPVLAAVDIGREEETGLQVFPRWSEQPVSIAGNVGTLQALANGVSVPFPTVELSLRGTGRNELLRAGATLQLRARYRGPTATRHRWEIVDTQGAVVANGEGDGGPPARIAWKPERSTKATALAARVCVDASDAASACSSYEPFGLPGPRGAGPKLARVQLVPRVLINGDASTLDKDGSFLQASTPDKDRTIHFDLVSDDGRSAKASLRFPQLRVERPTEPFPVQLSQDGASYRIANGEAGRIIVPVDLVLEPSTAELRASVPVDETRAEGKRVAELPVQEGRNRFDFTVIGEDGVNSVFELQLMLADRSPSGEKVVTVLGVPTLRVEAPQEAADGLRSLAVVQGRTERTNSVSIAGKAVPLSAEGRFAALAPLDAEGALVITVADPRTGRTGEARRTYVIGGVRASAAGLGDASPGTRFVLDTPARISEDDGGIFAGGAHAAGIVAGRSFQLAASLGAEPTEPTGFLVDGLAMGETAIGEHLRVGARVLLASTGSIGISDDFRLVPHGANEGVIVHAQALGAYVAEDFKVTVDAGYLHRGIEFLEQPPGAVALDRGLVLAGVGGVSRAGEGLELTLRAGIGAAAAGLESRTARGFPERFEGYAGLLYRPQPGALGVLARYTFTSDRGSFEPLPADAGTLVEHIGGAALDLPLGRFVLRQGLSLRHAGRGSATGSFTPYNLTRIEVRPIDPLLIAADYRVQLVPDAPAHFGALEANYTVLDGIRVGTVADLAAAEGGTRAARLLVRLQGYFD